MNTVYIEQRYCMKCIMTHWVEVSGWEGKEICHGPKLSPSEIPPNTHIRRAGRGFEILPNLHAPIAQEVWPIQWSLFDAE
jgi:hypothetical protein